ncbi:MAG: DUF6468 domain-containing protein [Devosia sp.]
MLGLNMGMLVEGSVAVLLAVTIGYCAILNQRLKRMHQDRQSMGKMISDLVQATGLANAAVMELKTAAMEAEGKLTERLAQAETYGAQLVNHINTGGQLVEKIARITAAARTVQMEETRPEPARELEPASRLQSALQQLAMRPGIGGRAA